MKSIFTLFLVTVSISVSVLAEEEKVDETASPSGAYVLIQKPFNPPLESCGGGFPCYETTVHFRDPSKPKQKLPPVGLAEQAPYQASAVYIISPDERFFVRDQHLFAGWNIVVLYEAEPNGKVRQVTDKIRTLAAQCALEYLHHTNKAWAKVTVKNFDHIAAEEAEWTSNSTFQVKIYARPDPVDPKLRGLEPIIDGWPVEYDVKTNKARLIKPSAN